MIRFAASLTSLLLLFVFFREAASALATSPTLPFDDDDDDAPSSPCSSSRTNLSSLTGRHRYSALACWLQELRLPLPDQSFREGILRLSLKDMVCSNFSVVGLESAYRPSNKNSHHRHNNTGSFATDDSQDDDDDKNYNPQLDVSIRNVSAICEGTYSSTGLSGSVRAVVGAHSTSTPALTFTWTIDAAPINHTFAQPVAIHTSDCDSNNIAVTDLHFSGSLSAKTIQIFVKAIRSSVTKALSSKLCPLVSQTLDPAFQGYIDQINAWLEPYLSDDDDDDDDGKGTAIPRVGNSQQLLSSQSNNRIASSAVKERKMYSQSTTVGSARALAVDHGSSKKEILKWSRDAPSLIGALQRLNEGLDFFLKQGILRHWLPIFDQKNRPDSCGFFFDGINSLIRSILYDNDGWVDIPLLSRWDHLHFVLPDYAALKLQIQNMSVHGLDHWDQLQLFAPDVEESFITLLNSHNITLRTRVHLVLSAVPDGVFKGDDLEEDFVIDLNATSLDTLLRFHVDADKSVLEKKVTVGTVWDVLEGVLSRNHTLPELPCLIESIDRFVVSDLSALWNIQSLSFQPDFNKTVVRESLEEDLDNLINNGLQVVWSEFPELVTESVKGLAKGPVLDGLNAFFDRITTTNNTCVAPRHSNYYPHLVDFTNVGWLRQMNDFFARSSTKRHIDSYLQCGADYVIAAIQERIPNGLFQVRTLALENVGQLQTLELLSPLPDGRSLSSGFAFGTEDHALLPKLAVSLDAGIPQARAALNLTLEWDQIGASSGLAVHYDLGRLKQYPLSQVIEHGQCLVVPTNEFDVYGVKSHMGLFTISLNATVDYGADPVHLSWKSTSMPEVQAVANDVWSWAVNSSRDMASLSALASMSQASSLCKGEKPAYEDEGSNEDYLSISLVVIAILFLAQPAVLMIRSENDESSILRRRLEEQQEYEDALMQPFTTESDDYRPESSLWQQSPKKSLVNHKNVPDVIRIIIPTFIICTIVLLICSNLSVGADVKLEATVAGQTISVPSLFSFSLYNTAKEMLQAKIYSLLLLVTVFSGIWPYLKLCLMLFGWIWAFSHEDAARRGRMFLALDALGKFSLVDTYVLVLMVVAFRYHLELSGGVELDVFVAPQFGFYGFLVGTVLSLVLSHALVFYHRRAEVVIPSDCCRQREALRDHYFQIGVDQKRLSTSFKLVLLALFLSTCAMLAIGMTRESFIFEFGGVAGDLIGARKDMAYSLISLGQALPQSVEHSSSLGIIFLQATYFFFAVGAPFACLFFFIILFACPLTLKQQFVVLTLAEVGNAWSAVEVFCLSIVAALLEISTFASFIVGDKCNLVDKILAENFEEVADTCYSVSASVSWSATFLVAGVIMNSFLVSLALRLAHTAVDENISRASSQPRNEDSLATREASVVEKIASLKGLDWIMLAQSSEDIPLLSPSTHDGAPSAL